MKKLLSKYSFWIIQIVSWVATSVFAAFAAAKPEDSSAKAISIIIALSLTGIITTSILRYYLKRNAPLEGFNGRSLLKIVISSILATFLLVPIGMPILLLLVWIEKLLGIQVKGSSSRTPLDWDVGMFLVIFFAFFFIIAGWVIFYYSIKFIAKSYSENLERLKLRNSVKAAQINMLRGQLDPNFMGKSLNGIRDLMSHDVDQSRKMITKLAEVLRFTLTNKNESNTSIDEELEIIKNYVDIYRQNTSFNIIFSAKVDQDLSNTSIPGMVMLSMVENVLKNGIDIYKKKIEIELLVFKEKDDLVFKIVFGGSPINKQQYEAKIKRLRLRLRLQFDDTMRLDVSTTGNQSEMIVVLSKFLNLGL